MRKNERIDKPLELTEFFAGELKRRAERSLADNILPKTFITIDTDVKDPTEGVVPKSVKRLRFTRLPEDAWGDN